MELLVALFIFLIGIAVGRYSRGLSENEGEGLIRKVLHKSFPDSGCHILNNVTLPYDDHTTQIDHILISTRGVFVIETKNYSGWIFADQRSKYWTQVIYKKKSKFQSPLRQNYKHQKAVEKLLDFLPAEAIHNLVVFTGNATFKAGVPEGVSTTPAKLVKSIKLLPEGVLSLNRVAFSVGRIECARYQLSSKTDYEHQSNLMKRFGDTV